MLVSHDQFCNIPMDHHQLLVMSNSQYHYIHQCKRFLSQHQQLLEDMQSSSTESKSAKRRARIQGEKGT
jgi:IS30 family transposase